MTDFDQDRQRQAMQGRRRNAGRRSLNMGLVGLGIAAFGYLLRFLLPLAVNSAQRGLSAGRVMFLPFGGIASLFAAVMAISIGMKVRRFVRGLGEDQRDRLGTFVELEKQDRYAAAGIALGIVTIVFNPLIAFFIVAVVTRA
jgi:hypothetical protein